MTVQAVIASHEYLCSALCIFTKTVGGGCIQLKYLNEQEKMSAYNLQQQTLYFTVCVPTLFIYYYKYSTQAILYLYDNDFYNTL